MSKCISRHGEYFEHTYLPSDGYVCEWCGVEDGEKMRGQIEYQAATIQRVSDLHKPGAHISAECRECMECSNRESVEYPCPTIRTLCQGQE